MAVLNHPGLGRFTIYDESNYGSLLKEAQAVDGFDRARLADEPTAGPYGGRDYDANPFGSMPWGNFPLPVIPRSEWAERIEQGNKLKTWSLFHHRLQDVPILDQGQTNYCWINSVCGAIMNARARNGLPTVALSSASAGAPGKNYANVGGWTGEAIKYIQKYGLVSQDSWPNAAIDRRYYGGTRDEAKQYKLGNWWELRPEKFDEIMTCLLLGLDVVVGLMWWGHSVRYAAPVQIGRNEFGVVDVNSWGRRWEDGGMSVLAESKANADEANCITTVLMAGDK